MIVPNFTPNNCVPPKAMARWIAILQNYTFIPRGSVKLADAYTNRFNPGCTTFLAKYPNVKPNTWMMPSGKIIGTKPAKNAKK
jgi:hypothetical protein